MRAHDWPERLLAFLASRERMPFRYGKRANDCCSFGASWVLDVTGRDPMEGVPDYTSAEEADIILAETPLDELLDARFPRYSSTSFAQRGDIGLAPLGDAEFDATSGESVPTLTLVVVEGAQVVGPGKRGAVRAPRSALVMAWKV